MLLQLRLMLPDGREETLAAKYGQTVQYTKAILYGKFDLSIDKQVRNFSVGQLKKPFIEHQTAVAMVMNLHV